jgi:hypothetical protein
MKQIDAYKAFALHRQQRGPGPALPVLDRTILMRATVPMATRINRARNSNIRKIAGPAAHNGRQQVLQFEQAAIAQRQAEDRVAREQRQLGDLLQQALRRLASASTAEKGIAL